MAYYGDLLRDFEKRYTKHYYTGAPVYLKFRTNPSESTSLAQSYKITRSSEVNDNVETVSYNAATGSTMKSTCCDK